METHGVTTRSPVSKKYDEGFTLNIQGTRQRLRLCASRLGLPPLLVVQAGPGFPLLNEVSRFQKGLRLEEDFTVVYWEQRGCGAAPQSATKTMTMETQQEDLEEIIRWLSEKTGQKVVILGVSIGGSLALRATLREKRRLRAVVAISPDTDVSFADAAAYDVLLEKSLRPENGRLLSGVRKLGKPPYTDPRLFQLRARLIADLGGIEHAKTFGRMMRGMFSSFLGTYGLFGTLAVLRNMSAVQTRLLPELVGWNLFTAWPQSGIPVRFVFGENDILVPPSLVKKVSEHLTSTDRLFTLPQAGHMVHFDQPQAVREIVMEFAEGATRKKFRSSVNRDTARR